VATGTVTLGASTATGTILDDDAAPTLSISAPSQPEGNAGNTPMNFVVSLATVSGRSVSFQRATSDGTATIANSDYMALAAALVTIPAGTTSVMIPVNIVGDTVFEGNERFNLNLTSIDGATPTSLSAMGTIEDDDQQPTTSTISSDLPDPSVTGQSYAVNVTVAAASTSPAGTVNVSDGAATCTLTLTAGTAPNSAGSCNLTSTTAGAKTLTASYVPASSAFAASSDTEAHQVNPAATTLAISGPSSVRLNTPASYTLNLQVSAPGAGIPAGTATLQSGANSCQISYPTATPSCSISFDPVGPRTISASFVPSNGDFQASNSGAGSVSTLVFALADLSVTKANAVTTYSTNDLLVYSIVYRNSGPDPVRQVRLLDTVPAALNNVAWTCTGQGGAVCPSAGGFGSIDQTYPLLASGAQLTYVLSGNVIALPPSIANTASVQLPSDGTVQDSNLSNNSATDTDRSEALFRNGFEASTVNAPSGSIALVTALSSLRSNPDALARQIISLDDSNGEATRVYARVMDGQLQLALATRERGALKLASWQSYGSDPFLTWTAQRSGERWLLHSAQLQ